jgi:hypothetical protein
MTTTVTSAESPSSHLRRGSLVVVAAVAGGAAVWLTSEYTRAFGSRGVAIRSLDARALALLFGPGIAGAGLLIAALLLLTRHRIGLGVYWGAVLVAVAVELLSRFGCLNLSITPSDAMQVVFIPPDFDESVLWQMGKASFLGLLIVTGYSLTTPRVRAGEPCVADVA